MTDRTSTAGGSTGTEGRGDPTPAEALAPSDFDRPQEVGVIDRSAAILTALQDTPMTAAEVCRRLGYSKSTTYRLLADLRTHRFIVRDSGGLLRLGPFPGRRSIATTNSKSALPVLTS